MIHVETGPRGQAKLVDADGRVVANGWLVAAAMPDDTSVPAGQAMSAQVTFQGTGTGE